MWLGPYHNLELLEVEGGVEVSIYIYIYIGGPSKGISNHKVGLELVYEVGLGVGAWLFL